MPSLSFRIEKLFGTPTIWIIGLFGAIDSDNANKLQEKLMEWQKQGALHLIFDMANLSRVNSTGMGVLVNIADALERSGGKIVLTRIIPKIRKIFIALGLNNVIKIFPKMIDAIYYFQNQSPRTFSLQEETNEQIELLIQLNNLQRRGASYQEILAFLLPLKNITAIAPTALPILIEGLLETNWNTYIRTNYVLSRIKQTKKIVLPDLV